MKKRTSLLATALFALLLSTTASPKHNPDGTPDDGSHIKFDAFTGTSNEPVLRIERSWVEVKVYHALLYCCCAVSKNDNEPDF